VYLNKSSQPVIVKTTRSDVRRILQQRKEEHPCRINRVYCTLQCSYDIIGGRVPQHIRQRKSRRKMKSIIVNVILINIATTDTTRKTDGGREPGRGSSKRTSVTLETGEN